MSWQDQLRYKTTTAQKAVELVKSDMSIVLGNCCGEPNTLIKALNKRADNLRNVKVFQMMSMDNYDYLNPGVEKSFIYNSLFVSATSRKAINQGIANYIPCFFSEIPRLFTEGYLPADVAIIQVSKPDEHGYCSFGVSVDYTKAAASAAKIVIAEINEYMPRTLGNSFIHISDIDCIVEVATPLPELPKSKPAEVEEKIGQIVSQLVEDGSTLQLGIGSIPDAVLNNFKNKKNLGIHSEMFSDGVVDLVEQGIINNAAKTLHKGKMLATFIMGSKKVYDFINNNPVVEMYSSDYTNDPYVIGKNRKMVCINSAIEVDLFGQVCADTIGFRQYSGVGGQVDFVRGASLSPGGKSIIALPSTTSDGKISRIVCNLSPGACVTTSRNENHYVVTEYGCVDLRGKTLKQRTEALISIAHPKFRDTLAEQYHRIR